MTNKASRPLIVFMFLCFAFMLSVSLFYRFTRPSLTTPNLARDSGGDQEILDSVGALMLRAAQNPSDQNALLRLTENLMAIGQWQTAENFAQKALALDKGRVPNSRALYLAALIHHNLGRHAQAAETLEKLLENGDNPSARYSLGILYAHYLDRPADGAREFRKGIESKNITPNLRRAMIEELEKLDNRPADQGGEGRASEPPRN